MDVLSTLRSEDDLRRKEGVRGMEIIRIISALIFGIYIGYKVGKE